MRVLRFCVWLSAAILAGAVAPASSAEVGAAAELSGKAVADFCLPSLQGGDPAAIATSAGAAQPQSLTVGQRAWTDKAGRGTYYSFPLRKGTLLFQAKRVERSVTCIVALFDVGPQEANQAFNTLDALFTAKGYEKIQGRPHPGSRASGYKGDNGSLIIILAGQEKDTAKTGVQLHIMMKRRLYAF